MEDLMNYLTAISTIGVAILFIATFYVLVSNLIVAGKESSKQEKLLIKEHGKGVKTKPTERYSGMFVIVGIYGLSLSVVIVLSEYMTRIETVEGMSVIVASGLLMGISLILIGKTWGLKEEPKLEVTEGLNK